MIKEKFYLTWSKEEPIHPKKVYKESWNSGMSWYGPINPSDKSLNQWKKEQVEKYNQLMKEHKDLGKVKKLNMLFLTTKDYINNIEKDVNFIKWCS